MEELKKRMMNPSQICKMQSQLPMAGYLYCQEKCKWTKNNDYTFHLHFCGESPKFHKLCELSFGSLWLSSSFCHQGLWGCRGWNITAGITRRAGCSPWCPVSRSLRPNRYWNKDVKQQEGQRRATSCDSQNVVSAAKLYMLPYLLLPLRIGFAFVFELCFTNFKLYSLITALLHLRSFYVSAVFF